MFAPNDYLLAGILFLALLFLVIDLWRFENGRDFAKKRLSHYSLYIYIPVTEHEGDREDTPSQIRVL